jgi:ubiquitin
LKKKVRESKEEYINVTHPETKEKRGRNSTEKITES